MNVYLLYVATFMYMQNKCSCHFLIVFTSFCCCTRDRMATGKKTGFISLVFNRKSISDCISESFVMQIYLFSLSFVFFYFSDWPKTNIHVNDEPNNMVPAFSN